MHKSASIFITAVITHPRKAVLLLFYFFSHGNTNNNMMCPCFLLLCPSLTSHKLDIGNTTRNPEPSSLSLSSHSFFQELFLHLSPCFLQWFCNHTSCVHMMNPTHAEFTTSNLNPCEDLKVRLRHHSLMQDYQELHMVPTPFFFLSWVNKLSFSLWVWSILSLDLRMSKGLAQNMLF